MKLTLKEKFKKFWGFGYVVNENTGEIHRLKNKHTNCHHNIMTNKIFITKKSALKKLEGLHDGCKYCWGEKDNG